MKRTHRASLVAADKEVLRIEVPRENDSEWYFLLSEEFQE